MENYPIRMEFRATNKYQRTTRGAANRRAVETGISHKAQLMFLGDATRLWNKAPPSVTNAESLWKVKKDIKLFCKLLWYIKKDHNERGTGKKKNGDGEYNKRGQRCKKASSAVWGNLA